MLYAYKILVVLKAKINPSQYLAAASSPTWLSTIYCAPPVYWQFRGSLFYWGAYLWPQSTWFDFAWIIKLLLFNSFENGIKNSLTTFYCVSSPPKELIMLCTSLWRCQFIFHLFSGSCCSCAQPLCHDMISWPSIVGFSETDIAGVDYAQAHKLIWLHNLLCASRTSLLEARLRLNPCNSPKLIAHWWM